MSKNLNSEAENCFDLRERRGDLREYLDWALGQLSPDNRMVVTLVHLEDHSISYAAQLLGLSKANVKIRTFRARRKLRKLIMKVLRWKLDLSDEQEERIGPIILKATGEFDRIHTNVKPKISSILETTIADINQELTSKQKQKFKKFYERVQSRWE